MEYKTIENKSKIYYNGSKWISNSCGEFEIIGKNADFIIKKNGTKSYNYICKFKNGDIVEARSGHIKDGRVSDSSHSTRKLTTEEFIKRELWKGSKITEFERFIYTHAKYLSIFMCEIHGEYEMTPNNYKKGERCPKCTSTRKPTTEEFIQIEIEKGSELYEFANFKYPGNSKVKAKFMCEIHGEYEMIPNSYQQGCRCPKCGVIKSIDSKKLTTEEFIQRELENGSKLSEFAKFKCDGTLNKSTFICEIHGEYEMTPSNYQQGQRCSKCKSSKGEREVRLYLESKNIKSVEQKRFKDCKNRRRLPFDFYLPELNICIEYDGEQHFKTIKYYGGEKGLKNRQKNDMIKTNYCKENGISLIRIPYYEEDIDKYLDFWIKQAKLSQNK